MLAAQADPSLTAQQQQQKQKEVNKSEASQKLLQLLKQRAQHLRGHQASVKAQLLLEASVWGVQGYPGAMASRQRWGMGAVAAGLGHAVRQRQAQRAGVNVKRKVLLNGIMKWHKVGACVKWCELALCHQPEETSTFVCRKQVHHGSCVQALVHWAQHLADRLP
jgi:hypothetical protein